MNLLNSASYLENLFYTSIPITGGMQIRVDGYDGKSLVLRAPLEPNVNDKGTAFGGSIFSLLVLSGWGLLHLKLREAGIPSDVMIHKSSITYTLPVKDVLTARCKLPDTPTFEQFINDVGNRGRGKILLTAVMMSGNRTAVEFSGNYVAIATSG
ncbi:MAG: thioesterase domain-containing protein [Geobacteraceae bacterium]|nr:thioesterase domain-containing protein [Geobacteraceae bacterium]